MGAAFGYLMSKQQTNGSWGTGGDTNIDSTTWVQTAINAIPPDPTHGSISWASIAGYLPMDAIAAGQKIDGAVRLTTDTDENRVWSTAYAVVAASGKSWLSVLQSFSAPVATGGGGGSVQALIATSTAATSTPTVATTTPPIITVPTPTLFSVVASSTAKLGSAASSTRILVPTHRKAVSVPHLKIATVTRADASSSTPLFPAANQAAAAGAAPSANLFVAIWHSVTSFLTKLF